jgi:hypothetical protein
LKAASVDHYERSADRHRAMSGLAFEHGMEELANPIAKEHCAGSPSNLDAASGDPGTKEG